jgi:hypothetical protein
MFPDNQSMINAVSGVGQQPQTAASSMNTTVDAGSNTPGGVSFGSPSPVNNNPNYAQTIMDYFNNNAIAGPAPFQNNPIQQGLEGNQAFSGAGQWNSFLSNDPHVMMQNFIDMLGGR